jgi:hypothetical protein
MHLFVNSPFWLGKFSLAHKATFNLRPQYLHSTNIIDITIHHHSRYPIPLRILATFYFSYPSSILFGTQPPTMGSSSSKAASTAKTASKLSSANTARKYPTRSPPTRSNRTNVRPERPIGDAPLGPSVHPETRAAKGRDEGTLLHYILPLMLLGLRDEH